MSEKTPGQVAYEAYWAHPPGTPREWLLEGEAAQDSWEAAATAARADLVAEVERLNAECCRLAGELAAVKVCGAGHRWEERDDRFVLLAVREVEAACVGECEPGGYRFANMGCGVTGADGWAGDLDLAKRLAELAAGVSRG